MRIINFVIKNMTVVTANYCENLPTIGLLSRDVNGIYYPMASTGELWVDNDIYTGNSVAINYYLSEAVKMIREETLNKLINEDYFQG